MDLVFLVIETPRIMNRVKELLRAFLTRMVQTASVLGAQTPVAGWDEWSGARVSSIWIPSYLPEDPSQRLFNQAALFGWLAKGFTYPDSKQR